MECLHIFNVFDNLTPFVLGALKRARHVSPSICLKKILSLLRTCHPSRESSNQEACGEWAPHPGYLPITAYTPIRILWWLHLLTFLLITAFAGSMTNARS